MKSKYVYAVTFRNEKYGHDYLIWTIKTDDNSVCYFDENPVRFFGRKKDAIEYAKKEVEKDWSIGMKGSAWQFE